MRKLVGALVVVTTLLWTLPSVGTASALSHKYGIELQLGGGLHLLSDVNDYNPRPNLFTGITPSEEMNMGLQFGIGILYRQMPEFGWQFGYNRFVNIVDQKFRITNAPAFPESWAEQTLSGGELYGLATWYFPWKDLELSFGVGPAIYSTTMDRSVDIANSDNSHVTFDSFSDASGKSFGGLAIIGIELPLKEMVGLSVQLGGRYAKIGEISYEDPNDHTKLIPVPLNSASGSNLPVDYSGAFLKVTLRGYFNSNSDWRNPSR